MTFRAACSFFALGGCLAAPAAHAALFSSPHGYSLSVPDGWHIESSSLPGEDAVINDAVITTNQPSGAGHRMTTALFQVQFRAVDARVTSANLGAINQGVLAAIRRHSSDLQVLSQTSSKLDGVRDLDCVFTAMHKGLRLRFHEVLVVTNNNVFSFTSICPVQVYPRYAAAYAQMLSSVRWKS